MTPTNLTYSKTIQSAQFEPETLEVVAVLEANDDLEKCAGELRSRITTALGRKAVGTATAAKTKVSKADADETTTKTETKTKTTKAKKPITYNREVKAHAKELGKILLDVSPGWKKDDDLKVKAKEASTNLVGTDFMDADGKVLDSFVEAVKEAMMAEGDDL